MAQRDAFFEKVAPLALTFDDVTLRTGYCDFRPQEIDLQTRFTRRIYLKIPVISAAMDTVTEAEMAIAMAKAGGIGVLHANLTPAEQQKQVRRVYYELNGLLRDPITVTDTMAVGEVLARRERHGWKFHTFPVLDGARRLVGIATGKDFQYCEDQNLAIGSIMTPLADLATASPDTTLEQAWDLLKRFKVDKLPLLNDDGTLAGMYVFSDVKRILKDGAAAMHNIDPDNHLRVAIACGIDDVWERIELMGKYLSVLVIDKMHADFADYHDVVRKIKLKNDNFDVVAGNISEGPSAKRLVGAGADCIKVGQGGGSICTTRKVSGIGCPQLTAVHDCAKAIEGSGVPICSDGGIVHYGHIPIALGAGADSVMVGNLVAGTTEAPGEIETQWIAVKSDSGEMSYQQIRVKRYRGMGSLEAIAAGKGSRYQQMPGQVRVPHGVPGWVPYKGDVATVIGPCLAGTRDGMAAVGAKTIRDLQERANFHQHTNAGIRESSPHDVVVITETPILKGGAA